MPRWIYLDELLMIEPKMKHPKYGFHRTSVAETLLALVAIFTVAEQCPGALSPGQPPQIAFEAAGMNANMESKIEQAVAAAIKRGDMPGCVVLIGRKAGIVFERAFGNRSIEPAETPMTTDTVFDMASVTKPVATATSIMILVERGQLRLQDKVSDFIPEFAANEKKDITIEQLLVHSSGLIPDNPLADYSDGWATAKPKICELKTNSEPGTAFKYSDVNFILLGKIVEIVSGKPVDEFARDEIYSKLGMKETGYLPSDDLKARAAPTEKRDDQWLMGEVHDPRAAKMGGVAGHAGLFSTAGDLATYAQMMLQQGEYGGVEVLSPATVAEMTRPRTVGANLRDLGWDSKSQYSRNRGELMSSRAFGHGGFTGTAFWIDPGLDLYVIFLSNRLHPDGVGEVNNLAGRIGAIACAAIESPQGAEQSNAVSGSESGKVVVSPRHARSVKLGIDVLAADGFKQLHGKRVGLITNHTGVDQNGTPTAKLLHDGPDVKLTALFSPEHGIAGAFDQPKIDDTKDETLSIPVYSLYGKTRRPTKEQLAEIDVLVYDIQDIGVRFYTYESTMCAAMEAAAEEGKQFVVLDRPNPIDGVTIEGPILDAGRESFVGYQRIPVRHGMTIGELATMFAKERQLDVDLVVVKMEGWRRTDNWFNTGLTWINHSPNMRSPNAALLYTGVGLLETTNVSVGRGTDAPFEMMGAPWIKERELAAAVNRANPPGVYAVPIRFTPNAVKFPNESCGGLRFVITDWFAFKSFNLGIAVACALRELYPNEWEAKRYMRLLGNEKVFNRVMAGDDPADILAGVDEDVTEFRARRKAFELYQ